MTEPHDIGWAVKQMYNGSRVARAGWNGKGMWLRYVSTANMEGGPGGFVEKDFPDGKLIAAPWVGMKTADNKFVPWLCSQTDLLALDWEIAT